LGAAAGYPGIAFLAGLIAYVRRRSN
jgi:hypothetical protein